MAKKFASEEERKTYNDNHHRVSKEFGKAKEYECEMDCGEIAAEWAQTQGTDGTLNDHFRALCRKCHRKYDDKWNAEERAKLSATLKRMGVKPPSHLGKKRSEETKRKMSEAQKARFAREGHHRTGSHHTEETKKRISDSNKATKARTQGGDVNEKV